jgi:hypothetical protein
MNRIKILIYCWLLLSARPVSAAIIGIDSSANDQGTDLGAAFANGVGHVFQLNTANIPTGQVVSVSQLGIDGFFSGTTANTMSVKLWDTANTTTPVATFIFDASSPFTTITYAHSTYTGRRYLGTLTTPVILDPAKTYLIAGYNYDNAGTRAYINNASTQTVAPAITFLQERYNSGAAGAIPNTNDGAAGAFKYGGPTFAYDLVAIPEPSTLWLLSGSLLTILRWPSRTKLQA